MKHPAAGQRASSNGYCELRLFDESSVLDVGDGDIVYVSSSIEPRMSLDRAPIRVAAARFEYKEIEGGCWLLRNLTDCPLYLQDGLISEVATYRIGKGKAAAVSSGTRFTDAAMDGWINISIRS